jgi:sugar O-acyltransferase (sialic acid O-acetyltransferase NeuD family)
VLPNQIVSIGYSGHAFVVIDTALNLGLNITHYLQPERATQNPFNLEYLGSEYDAEFEKVKRDFKFILGIGDNTIRSKIYKHLKTLACEIINVIDSSANISKGIDIKEGVYIAKSALVNYNSSIGNAALINTASIIEHDCIIDDFAHISPGAVLLGGVKIGACSLVGANSTVLPQIEIGQNSIIGAGSLVNKNIPSNQIWAGNPAKRIK